MAAPAPEARRTPPILGIRGTVAAATLLAGLLHVAVAPGRSDDWAAEGLALGLVGGLQVALAGGVVVSSRRRVVRAVVVVHIAVIMSMIVVHTSGYPFGPWSGYSPPLGAYQMTVLGAGAIGAAGALAMLRSAAVSPTGWRFENLTAVLVVAAASPGLILGSWGDNARQLTGAAHSHSHHANSELTDEEQVTLDGELARAAAVAGRLPTLDDALSAGWVRSGPVVPGIGRTVVRPDVDLRDVGFDIDSPLAYIYADDSPGAPVVGLEYAQWMDHGDTPRGFTGQSATWHMHMVSCVVDDTYAVPLDEPITGADCSLVGGRPNNSMSYMLRVWPVPDHPNPDGFFAHENPAIAG